MKHTILVPLALLRAACLVAKDEELLNIRNFDAVAINRGHIVATDGRLMFYSKLENVSDDISFIIPKAYAASFIKKTEFDMGQFW